MSLINRANTDKFETIFSNIPVPSTRTGKVNIDVFNRFVKTVTLPDYSMELENSDFQNVVRKNPVSRFNTDLSPLTIEFVLDEDLENYVTFYEWMNELRLGNSVQGSEHLHCSSIDRFTVIMNDNENRAGVKIIFNDMMLISLSSLNLMFGNSEQILFNTTFQYSTWDIERSTTIRNN